MKSKYITTIVFEGTDGVGKDTLSFAVWKKLNFRYHVYVRGEISDYVYAKKFNRPIVTTQNGLPFLYVVLTASSEHLKRNICKREKRRETIEEELAKIDDDKLFMQAAYELKEMYHIITIDVTDLTIEAATTKILAEIDSYINNLTTDKEVNQFNEMYALGCRRAGYRFSVRGNQPFINDIMVMADAHLHNGVFETYTNRKYPHNLLFSFAYNYSKIDLCKEQTIDFVYPINSKVLQRVEVYKYLAAFNKGDKTVLTTDSIFLPHMPNMDYMPKVFGDRYIQELSRAKATIYTSRDLADLHFMTVRVYESIIANNIIFVDKLTDYDCEILTQIYDKKDEWLINLLYVTPATIVKNYEFIIANKDIVKYILNKQNVWYQKLVKEYKVNYAR